jgi:hypothetical protein
MVIPGSAGTERAGLPAPSFPDPPSDPGGEAPIAAAALMQPFLVALDSARAVRPGSGPDPALPAAAATTVAMIAVPPAAADVGAAVSAVQTPRMPASVADGGTAPAKWPPASVWEHRAPPAAACSNDCAPSPARPGRSSLPALVAIVAGGDRAATGTAASDPAVPELRDLVRAGRAGGDPNAATTSAPGSAGDGPCPLPAGGEDGTCVALPRTEGSESGILPRPAAAPASPERVFGSALEQRILWMVDHGRPRVELRLDPPELGTLQINVTVDRNVTRVEMTTQHADVRALLQHTLPQLRDALSVHDGAARTVEITVHHADARDPGGGHGQTPDRDIDPPATLESEPVPAEHAVLRIAVGLLDCYA